MEEVGGFQIRGLCEEPVIGMAMRRGIERVYNSTDQRRKVELVVNVR